MEGKASPKESVNKDEEEDGAIHFIKMTLSIGKKHVREEECEMKKNMRVEEGTERINISTEK